MKSIVLFTLLSISVIAVSQEKLDPVDPLQDYQTALGYYNTESYRDAIQKLENIDENDSIFSNACNLRTNIFLAQEEYDELISYCDSLEGHFNIRAHVLINARGLGLLRSEKYTEAVQNYLVGIEDFPASSLFSYNLGLAYKGLEQYGNTLDALEKAIILNPYYAAPHKILAEIAYREHKITQAVLAWDTYLMLSPTAGNSLDVLVELNNAVSEKNTSEAIDLQLSEDDEGFEDIDLIVTNFAALSKDYKVDNKILVPLVKQNHVIFSRLSDFSGKGDFWEEKYVAFYKALVEAGQFNNFIYRIMLSSRSEKHQKVISKHSREQDAFLEWAADELLEVMGKNNTKFWGKPVDRFWYAGDGSLSYIGKADEQQKSFGEHTFFYSSGRILSRGYFTDDQRDKDWTWFYEDGSPDSEGTYSNGTLSGPYTEYYPTGIIKERAVYENDVYEGIVEQYNEFGALVDKSAYTEGKLHGKAFTYYAGGENYPKYDLNYEMNQLDSIAKESYPTGELLMEMEFDNGTSLSEEGYYRNGNISYKYTIAEGQPHGPFTRYYEDGTLQTKGAFSEGSRTGKWEYFYPDGVRSSTESYDEKGRLEGVYEEFSRTGEPYLEFTYSRDDLVAYRFYDSTGAIIVEQEKQNKKFDYQGFHPNGEVKAEGVYRIEGGKEGDWRYYAMYGNLASKEVYADGLLNGPYEEFFSNGFLSTRGMMQDDDYDGYYQSYYADGTLEMQGYYKDGKMERVWLMYYPNGTLQRKMFLKNGNYHGFQYSYSVEGKLADKSFILNDNRHYTVYYDATGKIMDTVSYLSGETKKYYYKNGNIRLEQEVLYGMVHGRSTWYHNNGKIETEGEYFLNERQGPWKWYYDQGKISVSANYFEDELDGEYLRYHSNGKLAQHQFYDQGLATGLHISFSESGDTTFKGAYIRGASHGPHYYYSDKGELQLVRYYEYDALVGYSYPDENGSLVAMIPVMKGTAEITGYYANGAVSRKIDFAGGDFHGNYLKYFSNGNLEEESHYIAGIQYGEQKSYYEDGTPRLTCSYLNDELHGSYRKYHPNGTLSEEAEFVCGEPVGAYRYFDASGKLIKKLEYFNGVVNAAEYH